MSSAGKYRLGRLIGGGGMAEVFEATAHGVEGFARPVAIKRMLPTLSREASFGQMFVNEARIAALLHHKNVVSVLDFDRDRDGRYFLVMELVRGVDLRHLAASGPLPLSVVAYVIGEVLSALTYAHELEHEGRPLGIVHRDVSPHNVMVAWDGGVKLVDFGIAKAVAATGASRSGGLKGKLAYMSPEQAHGVELDGRADVFAVGVMAHELITGQRLFPGHTEAEVLARLLSQPIPWPRTARPELPSDFEMVVMRTLERDRNARFATAQEAHEALLGTSVVDARAHLHLRDLMRKRFAEAPRKRADSEPAFAGTGASSSGLPMADLATVPQGRAAREMMSEQTRTSAPTPVAGALEEAPARASRRWLGVAVSALVAAAVLVAVAMTRGGSTGGHGTTASNPAVAFDGGPAEISAETSEPAPGAVPAPVIDPAAPPVDTVPAPLVETDPVPAERGRDAGARRHRDGEPAPRPGAPAPVPATASPGGAPTAPSSPGGAPAAAGTGRLSVKVSPWAQIYIDGKRVGDTPALLTLPAGEHQVQVINTELGKNDSRAIVVRPGETAEIRLRWGD